LYKHDTTLISAIDLPAALGLLTRLPIEVETDRAVARGAAAAWAYPLVGVIVGIGLASTVPLLLWLGLPGGVIAGLVLLFQVLVTGAMHEDGLADCADGFWGGWTVQRRLAIMKDSHIGVYGISALILVFLLRWLGLVVIVSVGAYWVAFMAVGALSRASMVAVMAALPHARTNGLSHSVGKPPMGSVWLALALGAAISLFCGYPWLILIAVGAATVCALIARAKIGGQTGDVLGATQQIVEVSLLIALTTMVI